MLRPYNLFLSEEHRRMLHDVDTQMSDVCNALLSKIVALLRDDDVSEDIRDMTKEYYAKNPMTYRVNVSIDSRAYDTLKKFKLTPRDAITYACLLDSFDVLGVDSDKIRRQRYVNTVRDIMCSFQRDATANQSIVEQILKLLEDL